MTQTRLIRIALCVALATCLSIGQAQLFNGSAERTTDVHGWYYIITGGKFQAGQTRDGTGASGGVMRYILDDTGWWYTGFNPALGVWHKDGWFPTNAGFALTLKQANAVVFDNNGIETASVPGGTGPGGYYTDTWVDPPSGSYAGMAGLFRGYAMSNNWDWIYAGYFLLNDPVTFDTIIGYYDWDGYTGMWMYPVTPYLTPRFNIFSEVAEAGPPPSGLPFNTGGFFGDVLTSNLVMFDWSQSYTGVDRIFTQPPYAGIVDPIWRVEFKLDAPVTLPAGEYYFSHDMMVADDAAPVDLNGRYICPSGSSPSLAIASTAPVSDRVLEDSLGTVALEGTYTPFSDDVKQPRAQMADLRGKYYEFEVDLGRYSEWKPVANPGDFPTEYFVVGLAANGTPHVWALFWKGDSGTGNRLHVEIQNVLGFSSGAYSPRPLDETKFRVRVSIDALNTQMTAVVTPLNGAGAFTPVTLGPLALNEGALDDVSNVYFFAGFQSYEPKSAASAELRGFTTDAIPNALYVNADDPYVKQGEQALYRVAHANLAQTVQGFQAFLSETSSGGGVQSFFDGGYTIDPFSSYIINPITAALDLASGIPLGGTAIQYNSYLARLRFSTGTEGTAKLNIDPDNGNPNIPTRFTDSQGQPVLPARLESNVVVVDETLPTLTSLAATQSHGNVLNGFQPVMLGNLTICVDAQDVGPLVNGSGLAKRPRISIDFAPPGPSTFDVVNAPMYSAAGNRFCYEYDVTGTAPCGTATLTITAEDDAGNAAVPATGTLTVNTTNVSITVQLAGGFAAGPVTREVLFTVGGTGGSNPPITVAKNVTFTSGVGTTTINALDTPTVPCGAAITHISAKDPLHTLMQTIALGGSSPSFTASFTGGDALIGGDANGDNLIDILDFGMLAWKFGTNYGTGDTPIGNPYNNSTNPHPDFSGNGLVDTADYTYIQTGFLSLGDNPVGNYGPQGTPKATATVREMLAAGIKIAPFFDLNRDGWVTYDEIATWLTLNHGGGGPIGRR